MVEAVAEPDRDHYEIDHDLLIGLSAIKAAMVEMSLDPALILTREGRIREANAALHLLAGYDKGELDGQLLDVLMTEETARRHLEKFGQAFEDRGEKGRVWRVCCTELIRKDRAPVPVAITVVEPPNHPGEPLAGCFIRVVDADADPS